MKIKSNNQMTFQPKTKRNTAATIFPSCNLVKNPHTNEVTGIIAKIKLTSGLRPK